MVSGESFMMHDQFLVERKNKCFACRQQLPVNHQRQKNGNLNCNLK